MSAEFFNWFHGSIAVDDHGSPLPFYHGTVNDFDVFDISKIRADETDAVYNGFWFTSDKNSASPAWRDPRFIKTCYLRLCNPAPHELARRIYSDVRNNENKYSHIAYRSYADAVRLELQRLGYDGMIHNDKARPNIEEFSRTGKSSFTAARGSTYHIAVDKDYGGVNLYDSNWGLITGYEDYNDFISQHSERTFVVFDPNQIFTVSTDLVIW